MRAQRRGRARAKTDRGRLATDSYTPRDGQRDAVSEATPDLSEHELPGQHAVAPASLYTGHTISWRHCLLGLVVGEVALLVISNVGAHRHQRCIRSAPATSTAELSACPHCWR